MSTFSPTPRQIFNAVTQVSGIEEDILRDADNKDDNVVQARQAAFLFARLWTDASYDEIPEQMDIDVSPDVVIEGISEAGKALYSSYDYVREVLMCRDDNPFEYEDRSRKDYHLNLGICKYFNDLPKSGFVIEQHAPLSEPWRLFNKDLIRFPSPEARNPVLHIEAGAILRRDL